MNRANQVTRQLLFLPNASVKTSDVKFPKNDALKVASLQRLSSPCRICVRCTSRFGSKFHPPKTNATKKTRICAHTHTHTRIHTVHALYSCTHTHASIGCGRCCLCGRCGCGRHAPHLIMRGVCELFRFLRFPIQRRLELCVGMGVSCIYI